MEQIRHAGRLFRVIERALAQEIRRNHEKLGITSSQGFVLGYLSRRYAAGETPIYAKEVERYFGVRHSSVSGVLQRMEQKGFLRFEPDPTDRRCKQIVLTDKALQIREQIEKQILATERKVYAGMSPAEQDEFTRLLRQAAENLTDGAVDAPPPLTEEDRL